MARHNTSTDELEGTTGFDEAELAELVNEDTDIPAATDNETDTPAEGAAEPKAKKEPARGDLPEGVLTPVGFAKELTKLELHTAKDGSHEVKPQMVYSYIRNASKSAPFPVEVVKDSLGHDRQVINVEAGIAWWTAKNERVAERAANAKAKEDKKAEKVASQTTTEAEGDEPSEPVAEAE